MSSYNGIATTSPAYNANYDMNRDGKIDQADADYAYNQEGEGSAVQAGWLGDNRAAASGPRLNIGYCGYVFNEETSLYTVRFRNYSPLLGRWLERDPMGYVDGMGLYEYVSSDPLQKADPLGLMAAPVTRSGTCKLKVCVDNLEACTNLAAKRAKLERVKELIVEACGEDDPDSKVIQDAWALGGKTIFSFTFDTWGNAVTRAGRDLSIQALKDADEFRKAGKMMKYTQGTLAVKQATGIAIGGKCLGFLGSAFDIKEAIDGVNDGDFLEFSQGASGAMLSLIPGGAIPGMVASVAVGSLEAYMDYRVRQSVSRKSADRCSFFKSLRVQFANQANNLDGECRSAIRSVLKSL